MARNRRSIPPFFSTREVLHLAALGTLLVVVIASMDRLRRPSSLGWLLPEENVKANLDRPLAEAAAVPAKPLVLKNTGDCSSVDRSLLAAVKDKTPASAADKPAVYQFLCVAATQPRSLTQAARHDVAFANLFNDPDKYRGQAVHLSGVLARLLAWEGKENDNPFGVARYYEAWVFPEDQPTNPVVFLFTELPPGLSPGTSLKETTSFDGYFVKLLAYQTKGDEWRAAPMLVGKSLQWRDPRGGTMSAEAMLTAVGLIAILALAGFAFWRQSRGDERLAAELHASVDRPPPADLSFLSSEPSPASGANAAASGDQPAGDP